MTVHLACGHSAETTKPHRVGSWVSCWAVMYPQQGCQCQRKVVSVTGQGVLW